MKKIKMKQTIFQKLKISGRYRIYQGGKLVGEGENIITNVGLELILQRLCNSQLFPKFIEIGTHDFGGSPSVVDQTDTTLFQSIAGATVDVGGGRLEFHDDARQEMLGRERNLTTPKNKVLIEFISDWPGERTTNVNQKKITEAGIFNRYKLGSMLSHFQTSPIITIKESIPYSVAWELQVEISDDAGLSGGIVYDGLNIISNTILQKQNNDENIQNQISLDFSCTHIGCGSGVTPVNPNDTDLNVPFPLGVPFAGVNGLRRITGFKIDTAVPAKPTLTFQRYINEFMFPSEIKEVGLFNVREETYQDGIKGQRTRIQTMFGRAVLETPIPANTESLIDFKISIERGI